MFLFSPWGSCLCNTCFVPDLLTRTLHYFPIWISSILLSMSSSLVICNNYQWLIFKYTLHMTLKQSIFLFYICIWSFCIFKSLNFFSGSFIIVISTFCPMNHLQEFCLRMGWVSKFFFFFLIQLSQHYFLKRLSFCPLAFLDIFKKFKWLGCLAGSVSEVYNSWSWSYGFEPHVLPRAYLKKKKIKRSNICGPIPVYLYCSTFFYIFPNRYHLTFLL